MSWTYVNAYMAARRACSLSLNILLIFFLFVIFDNSRLKIIPDSVVLGIGNIYFASQLATKVEIKTFHSRPVERSSKSETVSEFWKGYVACKIFQHATLALALIALA